MDYHRAVDDVARLVRMLQPARRILVFTGAGISTGSGIPDFRGPQGVWKTRQPVYFHDFLASESSRIEYWQQKAEGYESFRDAQPNATHRAIADLERMGRVEAVVTQNIDGLHHEAGSSRGKVIEVHGTNRWVTCLGCGAEGEPGPAFETFRRTGGAPTCDSCGGFLKPATISFGQTLDSEVLARAFAAADTADLAIALGSTLSVHPAASVPQRAAERGAPYVIVNRGETEHDALADLRLEGDVADLFVPAVVRLTQD